MPRYLLLVLMTTHCLFLAAQDLKGAWQWTETDDSGNTITAVAILADGFQSAAKYDLNNKKFISTNGGTWSYNDGVLTETVEFDTRDSSRVGTTVNFEVDVSENEIIIKESGKKWTRIDDGTPGDLAGAWLISGRKVDGEIRERNTNRPRKTMKILSGTRFQWIAYNTETKSFMGTGGGTYTTADGKYTENIEFFSRDNSRAGASLEFNYELIDGKWHHSGKSSKGSPIYEIWSIREQ